MFRLIFEKDGYIDPVQPFLLDTKVSNTTDCNFLSLDIQVLT